MLVSIDQLPRSDSDGRITDATHDFDPKVTPHSLREQMLVGGEVLSLLRWSRTT